MSETEGIAQSSYPEVDVYLRSSDDIDFPTLRAFLAFASPVLKTQLTLPVPSLDVKDGLPVLRTTQSSRTLGHLIPLLYPISSPDPPLETLSDVRAVLIAASHYRMDRVLKQIEYWLKTTSLVNQDPVGVFSVAIRFNLRDAAIAAAKSSLRLPLFGRPYQPEFENISAGDIYRLQEFHTKCTAGIRAAALGGSILISGLSLGQYKWITRDSFVWFTCTACATSFQPIAISGGRSVQTRRWWIIYMHELASALAESPCSDTLLKPNTMEKAIDGADPCDVCRRRVVYDMKDFHEMLLTEINRVMDDTSTCLHVSSSGQPELPPPVISKVNPPFDHPNPDVILRTVDKVDFNVHKVVLSLAAPIFDIMFTLPQSSDKHEKSSNLVNTPSIIEISEGSQTMERFLEFCYPTADPVLNTLDDIREMLEVMRKYETDQIRDRVRKLLVDPKFLARSPLRVFAIAHRYKLADEARIAAKHMLQLPLFGDYVPELEFMTAGAYHRFEQYYLKCQTTAARSFSKQALGWLPTGLRFTNIFGTTHAIGTAGKFIWFACRRCAVTDSQIRVSGGVVQPTQWWMDYMQGIALALAEIPSHSTKLMSKQMDLALEKAVACEGCRERVIPEMREFNSMVAAEIDRVISTVRLEIKF